MTKMARGGMMYTFGHQRHFHCARSKAKRPSGFPRLAFSWNRHTLVSAHLLLLLHSSNIAFRASAASSDWDKGGISAKDNGLVYPTLKILFTHQKKHLPIIPAVSSGDNLLYGSRRIDLFVRLSSTSSTSCAANASPARLSREPEFFAT